MIIKKVFGLEQIATKYSHKYWIGLKHGLVQSLFWLIEPVAKCPLDHDRNRREKTLSPPRHELMCRLLRLQNELSRCERPQFQRVFQCNITFQIVTKPHLNHLHYRNSLFEGHIRCVCCIFKHRRTNFGNSIPKRTKAFIFISCTESALFEKSTPISNTCE